MPHEVVFWYGEHKDGGHKEGFYTPRCTKQWQTALSRAWEKERGKEIAFPEGWLEVEATFYFHNGHSPDPDNLLRRLLNALNERAWSDDNQVIKVTAVRVHGAEKEGVEIRIRRCE